jgi:hypothetical protein
MHQECTVGSNHLRPIVAVGVPPKGGQFVYTLRTTPDDLRKSALSIIDADGTNRYVLRDLDGLNESPAWSP